jgi:hypothetical protein
MKKRVDGVKGSREIVIEREKKVSKKTKDLSVSLRFPISDPGVGDVLCERQENVTREKQTNLWIFITIFNLFVIVWHSFF